MICGHGISGLRSGFYFDNLIKRFAVLTKIQSVGIRRPTRISVSLRRT
jgi:hypothetical protein